MTGPLAKWWLGKYLDLFGVQATPLEICPACGRRVGVQAVDRCFLLHGTDAPDETGRHETLCIGSGKRAVGE